MCDLAPNWEKAFYRFRAEEARYGSNASYIIGTDVFLVGALKQAVFYSRMNDFGAMLLKELGKSQGVFLLTIDAEFNYDIKFEWSDLHRWEITKLDGGTGLPKEN
ncbi:hypothetical protein C2I19_11420 [Chromobacterium alticapitis]|uniref:Uncharacterized protein n=2 Tax=Chromobacterium alticapitis TaxID=2073169 RepID=A0A2S5DFU7_9NEIS|nr:hypothetical protein C2I19_11420 [Chromobacterium alticapitis]